MNLPKFLNCRVYVIQIKKNPELTGLVYPSVAKDVPLGPLNITNLNIAYKHFTKCSFLAYKNWEFYGQDLKFSSPKKSYSMDNFF